MSVLKYWCAAYYMHLKKQENTNLTFLISLLLLFFTSSL